MRYFCCACLLVSLVFCCRAIRSRRISRIIQTHSKTVTHWDVARKIFLEVDLEYVSIEIGRISLLLCFNKSYVGLFIWRFNPLPLNTPMTTDAEQWIAAAAAAAHWISLANSIFWNTSNPFHLISDWRARGLQGIRSSVRVHERPNSCTAYGCPVNFPKLSTEGIRRPESRQSQVA